MNGAPDGPQSHAIDFVLIGVCVGVLGAALFVAAVAGLAGLAFGDGWVGVPLNELPRVLARLPERLDDPRVAWPRPARERLPGLGAFVVVSAALLVWVGVCAGLVIRALRRPTRAKAASPEEARWARRRDLRRLRVGRNWSRRVVLGHQGRRLLAAEQRQSVLVVAPTQSGKTTGLAIPAILDWDGPVLATSIKSDLVDHSRLQRMRAGEVRVFDPSATTGLARASWSPLAVCTSWEGARKTADRLARASKASPQSLQEADFWSQAAARFLAPLLLAAARSGHDMGDVSRWIDAEEHEEVLLALKGDADLPARNALLAAWGSDDRLRASLSLTASLALEAYNDPAVLECGRRTEITADWLLGGTNTVFLCAPIDEQARLRPLFTTLVREVIAEVYVRSAARSAPIDPPLLVVLDEAANIAPLPDLDQLASTGAGQGLQLVTVVQDLSQIHERWGGKADTVVNNHRAKLFGAGTSCVRTLDYIARVLGDAALPQTSRTDGEHGRRSTTESTTFRALAPPTVVREGKAGSMLLLYGSLPPTIVHTRPWDMERRFRRLRKEGDQCPAPA
jgi:type IV secretion system protein VirD4